MGLHYSKFNIVNTFDGKFCSMYNTRSTKHLIFNLKYLLLDSSDLRNDCKIEKLPLSIQNELKEQGFILDAEVDEITDLKKTCLEQLEKSCSGLYLTILPTLQCNFYCNYCYEDLTHADKFMLAPTIDSLCKFVEAKLASGIKGELRVKWFGGEPLLAKEIIFDLSGRLQNLAAQYQVNYNAILVTNGYLLDQLSAQEITKLELKTIQVTLDGPERVHNIRRPRRNWDGSYAQIVANIEALVQFYSDLVIRINIDKNNAPYIHELFIDLEKRGLLSHLKHFHFAYVDTQIGRYSKAAVCREANQANDIVRSHAIITANLIKHGFAKYAPITYPRVIPAACDAQIKNHYVINPDGYIFKCLGDATTNERAIYHLNSAKAINTKREEKLQALDLCMHKLCSECAMLPICHSGCRAKYLDLNESGPFCRGNCHTLRQQLITIARSKLQ